MAANTLNLGGDGDGLDIVRDVERTFGIRFADADMETCHPVGLLVVRKGR